MGILSLVALLTGCSAQQTIQDSAASGTVLPANQKSAYVTTPSEGRDGASVYFRSGTVTADIVADAFAPYFMTLTLGGTFETRDTALDAARAQVADYLIETKILRWRDVDTAWSGSVDQATIALSIVDTKTGHVVKSGQIDAKGSFLGIAAGHPEDYLAKPVRDFAESAFGQ